MNKEYTNMRKCIWKERKPYSSRDGKTLCPLDQNAGINRSLLYRKGERKTYLSLSTFLKTKVAALLGHKIRQAGRNEIEQFLFSSSCGTKYQIANQHRTQLYFRKENQLKKKTMK
jgi:hypothetical protein